ncbi:dynamin family protein [Paractinoplanes rishiriensis]|uniref:Dynamin N-terminal domain-containing protein n=1 Tax=Paractinoplanes rishiriensis TaxID=1050105 RepID=A0A919KBK7_9ACTN|nr:dynamin family protein [Actinoplanes rishiriensis]GIF02403.1 hypothetical protein Ari01nite_98670 [Actinoplanes rishiriensis]
MPLADRLAERADLHLDLVHRLLTDDLAPLIDPARRDDLLDQLGVAWDQVAAAELRLAVLGEFSSGKSSLINAFLRDAVLPASARESTVVSTDIVSGRRFSVGLCLEPEGRWLDVDRDRALWRTELPELSGLDARAVLTALTADAVPARRVHALRVTHPSRGLGPGIVIVDTPGIAGRDDDRTAGAAAGARARADLVLVVVPANAAFSRTLTDLLTGPLGDCRDRFLFAVTKVDQLDADERKRFVRSVHRSLVTDLGLPSCPLIFTVAPAVLPGWRPRGGDVDWSAGFADGEDLLRRYLAGRRPPPTAAPDPGLLADLLHAVNREVARARQDVRTMLDHTRAPDLGAALDSLAALATTARSPNELIKESGRLAYAIAGGPPELLGPFVGAAPGTRAALRAVTGACARYLTAVYAAAQRRRADLYGCDDRLAGWGADLVRRIASIRSASEGI